MLKNEKFSNASILLILIIIHLIVFSKGKRTKIDLFTQPICSKLLSTIVLNLMLFKCNIPFRQAIIGQCDLTVLTLAFCQMLCAGMMNGPASREGG